MELIEHLSISLLLGLFLSLILRSNTEASILIVGVAVVSGTLIDLDHFVLARYLDGDWEKLLVAFRNPFAIIVDNEGLIEEKWLPPLFRLKSHLTELSLLVAVSAFLESLFFAVAAFSVSIHILCDVWADWRKGYLGGYLG